MKVLNSERIIYANLKPQNIWLNLDNSIKMKIVDYSQTTSFENLKYLKFNENTTLEYFPPEILEYVRSRNLYKKRKTQER